jgi:hypothetical protein
MQQASVGDGLSFDPFPFDEDGLAASEVDVGRCQVAQALVVSQVADLGFEVAGQVVVFEPDAALEREMPSLDLALGRRMVRLTTGACNPLVLEPLGQIACDAGRPVIAEQTWPPFDPGLARSRVSVPSEAAIVA